MSDRSQKMEDPAPDERKVIMLPYKDTNVSFIPGAKNK